MKRNTAVVELIMQSFDFHKVHKVMWLLGWEWALTGGREPRVPTVDDLRETARDLLERVKPGHRLSRGGFEATDHSLRFIVASYSWED